MIFNSNGCNKVMPFKDFISQNNVLDLINEYILKGSSGKKVYMIENNTIHFSITKYNYHNTGLIGNYDDFYEYSDTSNKTYIISTNEAKLKGFCGYINSLTS
jgi:hypothetical protein